MAPTDTDKGQAKQQQQQQAEAAAAAAAAVAAVADVVAAADQPAKVVAATADQPAPAAAVPPQCSAPAPAAGKPYVPYRAVDFASLPYQPMIKDTTARLYAVPIEPPVRALTPPVATASDMDDDMPFLYLAPTGDFKAFLKRSEDAVLAACIANKASWFAKSLDDDALRRGFKSFFRAEDGAFKLKVPADVGCFDAAGAPVGREDVPSGSVVRAVLELSRVCFGRHEFGVTWKLVQLKLVPTVCLIVPEEEDPAPPAESDSDSDAHEFM